MIGIDFTLAELLPFAVAFCAAGLIAGLLAGIFGIGGGAVLVPVFYQAAGLVGVDEAVRMHISVGTSLAVILPTSIRSFMGHRAKNAVDEELLRSFLIVVPVGVVMASLLAALISSAGLRVIFAIIAILVGLRLLFNRDDWSFGTELPAGLWRRVAGFAIGFLSTLMGIGGGVLNNTFMTAFGRPMHQAVATSSGVGVLISIPGTIGYIWAGWANGLVPPLSTGFVNWIAVLLIIPMTLVAAPYGVRMAHAMKKRHLEIAFGGFLLFVAARFFASLAS